MANYFEWNDSYSVGVKAFDEDHKIIMHLLNELLKGHDSKADMQAQGEILIELIKYTRYHFRHEEELMIQSEYPDYPAHREHHDLLFDKVLKFTNDYLNRAMDFMAITTFLMEWWLGHIQEEDKQYKGWFNGRGIH
ncbi:MAG: bacteriohemerythrin [Deltaproteobacteria bacterium]|nr:bacteriohemerythrin [Deltaproteobacteria bacterium]